MQKSKKFAAKLNKKKLFLSLHQNACQRFSLFFSGKTLKTFKIKILTSIWGAQHPHAGLNIQQII